MVIWTITHNLFKKNIEKWSSKKNLRYIELKEKIYFIEWTTARIKICWSETLRTPDLKDFPKKSRVQSAINSCEAYPQNYTYAGPE